MSKSSKRVETLKFDLQCLVDLLDANIEAEEESSGISDPSNLDYPKKARRYRLPAGQLNRLDLPAATTTCAPLSTLIESENQSAVFQIGVRPSASVVVCRVRPTFFVIFGISISRQHLRIRPLLPHHLAVGNLQLAQSALKHIAFGCHFAAKLSDDPLMQIPQVVGRHRLQVAVLHVVDQNCLRLDVTIAARHVAFSDNARKCRAGTLCTDTN